MSVRLFGVLDPGDPSIGRLDAAAARHLRARRVAPGDAVVLVLGPGVECDATVLRFESGGATCRVGATRPARAADPGASTWLCVGLADPARLDLVVEKATELGASAIAVFRARRSQLAAVTESRVERWRRIARSACEQCGRTVPPAIEVGWDLQEVVDLVAGSARALVFVAPREETPGAREHGADPADEADATGSRTGRTHSAGTSAPDAAEGAAAPPPRHGNGAAIVLVVGPEGGLDAGEVSALVDAGARETSLGPRVLRFETAAIAALARHAPWMHDGPAGVPGDPLE